MGDEKEELKEVAPTKEAEGTPHPVDAPQPEEIKKAEPEADSPRVA